MIESYPKIILAYYHSLNTNEHTTKLRYITNVLRFMDYEYPNRDFDIKALSKLSRLEIEEYISAISFYGEGENTKELKASSKACILSSLSSFFKFLVDSNYLESNPMETIKRPKIKQNDVTYLTPEEVIEIEDKILNEGAGNKKSKAKQEAWKHRDFLLFHIPVVNGIRIEALREINISDLHLDEHAITVTEKGNITKDVFIDDTAIYFIKSWMNTRFSITGNNEGALFISNRKKRITARAIENIIKKYADGINGKHITPHKLRSTFGTNAYQITRDIKAVAEGLGHKSTVPTERYVKTFKNRTRTTVNSVANLYKRKQ